MTPPSFEYVEARVRKKTFGILRTIDQRGRPHSTSVLYGVSPPTTALSLYVATLEHYAKVRYIRANPVVNLIVTFPHRILSFVPANCVTFRGKAVIAPVTDSSGVWAFQQRRILRDNLDWVAEQTDPVFIRIDPESNVLCYGLGIPLNRIRRDHVGGRFKVRIPNR